VIHTTSGRVARHLVGVRKTPCDARLQVIDLTLFDGHAIGVQKTHVFGRLAWFLFEVKNWLSPIAAGLWVVADRSVSMGGYS
jgi:hypothetical protein